ncbi:helix-turn-helix domain-containing protein [Streptomyces bacillaris]|uniref:helix-turn-helix domain-containing protein n=1 Tax=Streptomyces bacillaris TaxID=68179 RepID=UPI0038290F53
MTKPPISDAARIFGERVRARRQELGLSQEQIAEGSQMHWSYFGQVERGRRNLTLHNILKIAEALKIDSADLVRGLKAPEKSD